MMTTVIARHHRTRWCRVPRLSRVRLDPQPEMAGHQGDQRRRTPRLWPTPSHRLATGTAARQRLQELDVVDRPSVDACAASMPPRSTMLLVQVMTKGNASARATILRHHQPDRRARCPSPTAHPAPRVTRITPSCAVIAEPRASRHQDRREQRPQLAPDADPEDVDDDRCRRRSSAAAWRSGRTARCRSGTPPAP